MRLDTLKFLTKSAVTCGYQLSKLTYQALGHSIIDPIIYQYLYKLGLITRKAIFLYDTNSCANPFVFTHISRFPHIFLDSESASSALNSLPVIPSSIHDTSSLFNNYRHPHPFIWDALHAYSSDCNALAAIDLSDSAYISRYHEFLERFNVTPGKYICLHFRTAGYKSEKIAGNQDFRNTDPLSLFSLLEYLYDNNLKVIQMGSQASRILDHPCIIPYPSSAYSCPFFDLFITSNCLAWIGDSSGASGYALLFQKPRLLFNMPLSNCVGYTERDYFVPMQLSANNSQLHLTFKECFQLGLDRISCSSTLTSLGYSYTANSPHTIRAAASLFIPAVLSSTLAELMANIRSQPHNYEFVSTILPSSFVYGTYGAAHIPDA